MASIYQRPSKRPRPETKDLTPAQVYPLFATINQGLALQPNYQPVLNDANLPYNNNTPDPYAADDKKKTSYQIFHAYSENGANPTEQRWTRSYAGITQIRLNRCTFPISFLRFPYDQVFTYVRDGLPAVNMDVPQGNYAFSELVALFAEYPVVGYMQLSRNPAGQAVLSCYGQSGPLSASIDWTGAKELKRALGFDFYADNIGRDELPTDYVIKRVNGVETYAAVLVGKTVINLSLPPFIYLQGRSIGVQMRGDGVETGNGYGTILATIPITGNTGDIVTWENSRTNFYETSGSTDYLWDTFMFTDPSGNLIDFQGAAFDIELGAIVTEQTIGIMSRQFADFSVKSTAPAMQYDRPLFPNNQEDPITEVNNYSVNDPTTNQPTTQVDDTTPYTDQMEEDTFVDAPENIVPDPNLETPDPTAQEAINKNPDLASS